MYCCKVCRITNQPKVFHITKSEIIAFLTKVFVKKNAISLLQPVSVNELFLTVVTVLYI